MASTRIFLPAMKRLPQNPESRVSKAYIETFEDVTETGKMLQHTSGIPRTPKEISGDTTEVSFEYKTRKRKFTENEDDRYEADEYKMPVSGNSCDDFPVGCCTIVGRELGNVTLTREKHNKTVQSLIQRLPKHMSRKCSPGEVNDPTGVICIHVEDDIIRTMMNPYKPGYMLDKVLSRLKNLGDLEYFRVERKRVQWFYEHPPPVVKTESSLVHIPPPPPLDSDSEPDDLSDCASDAE